MGLGFRPAFTSRLCMPGGALSGKERVRSLLQRMEGCLRGARSLLPDFAHAPVPGEPLIVAGEVRARQPRVPPRV